MGGRSGESQLSNSQPYHCREKLTPCHTAAIPLDYVSSRIINSSDCEFGLEIMSTTAPKRLRLGDSSCCSWHPPTPNRTRNFLRSNLYGQFHDGLPFRPQNPSYELQSHHNDSHIETPHSSRRRLSSPVRPRIHPPLNFSSIDKRKMRHRIVHWRS